MELSQAPDSMEPLKEPDSSPNPPIIEKDTVKRLLAEARSTREVLADFRAAVEKATFAGSACMPIAKGLSFLDVILMQNQAHISNLQDRSEGKP